MNIDVTLSGEQNLVNLISASNGNKPLTVLDVVFGLPTAFDNGLGGNTTVEATADAESASYVGVQSFNYNRLDLATEATYADVAAELLAVSEAAVQADVLASAVETLGLIASQVEVTSFTAPAGDVDGSLVIGAVDGSLLYTGSIAVALRPIDQREDMSEAFATQDLNSLEAPVAAPE